jgi:hypothetical protein
VLQNSADIKALMWLDAVFIVLSGQGIRRLIYLISLTSIRDDREHYSSCNTANVD